MKQNKSELLFASMEYIDQDMVESAAAALAGKKKYGRPILKWSAVAAAVCVLVSSLAVFAILRNTGVQPGPIASSEPTGAPPTSTATSTTTSTATNTPVNTPVNTATPKPTPDKPFQLPTSAEDIVWSNPEQSGPNGDGAAAEWHGLWIDDALYEALKELNDESYVAVHVLANDPELQNRFVYNGKTYEALWQEWDALWALSTKLEFLLKDGHELKYGDALYTTGVPYVGKWTEAYYQQKVDYYGVDLLNQYIKDGEFLSDAVEKDMQQTATDIETLDQILTDANGAYLLHSAEEMYDIFAEKGYCVTVKNGSLYLFVQKAAFANLDIPNRETYLFYLASRQSYEWDASATPLPTVTPIVGDLVSGFAVEKFNFASLDTAHRTPTSDSEVIAALNETMAMWQYTYDHLEFIFSCADTIDRDCFTSMHYTEIWETPLSKIHITLKVPYEDIDVEALKALSQMDEIYGILVWGPQTPSADAEGAVAP